MLGNIGVDSVAVPDVPAATSTAADTSPDDLGDAIAERVRKRRKTHDSTKAASPQPGPSSSSRRSHIAEVVVPTTRPRPKVVAPPPVGPPPAAALLGRRSPSTSFSPVDYSSGFSSGSHLGPPSTIGTSRSVPDLSSHSLQLEVDLLQSRLRTTELLLRREQEQSRQELITVREQFAAERKAFRDYIAKLRGDMQLD